MKLPKNRQSGQVLILALILLAVGGALMVPTLNLAYTSVKYHGQATEKTLEVYSADSGVQYALCKLRNDPEGYKAAPVSENFTLNGKTVYVTIEHISGIVHKITSTGTSDSGRSTTIECYTTTTSGLLEHVAVSNGDMQLQETIVTSAPVEGEADIFINGDFQLQESTVYGDVTYTGNLNMDEYSVVTGELTQGGEPEELPPVDAQYWEDAAKAGGTNNGNKQIKDKTDYHLGPLYITGDLQIQNSSVILDGTVYVVGQIQMQDNSTVVGSSVLVAEGLVQLQGASYDTENIPMIMSVYNSITVQAGSEIGAVLYAPNGDIKIQDYSVLYGSAIGNYVQIQKSILIYTADIQSSEGIPGSQIDVFTYSY